MKQTTKYFLMTLFFSWVITHTLSAQDFIIEGKWKISWEDKKDFSTSDFDDVTWTDLNELRWKDDLHKTANRVLWIRKSVVIPSSMKAAFEKTGILTLTMGKIQQSDQTYLNGKLVGTTGSGDSHRNYLIKKEDILWDKENKIAIRVNHWGEFKMSIIPKLIPLSPEHFFVFSTAIKNTEVKKTILNKDLTYQLVVNNKSIKGIEGILNADFYNFAGTKIHSDQKYISLSMGKNVVDFPYKSLSPFVKIIYSLSIPSYEYKAEWNAEFGYEDIVYHQVEPVVPTAGNVSITVNPSNTSKFKVLFRKPYWADNFILKINNIAQSTKDKIFEIERIWKKDDKVDITFSLPIKVLEGNISYSGKIALQRGPQVLVFDQKLNKAEAKNVIISENSLQLEPVPNTILPPNWVGTQFYQVNAQVNGVSEKIFLVPYADAGQTGDVIATWLKSNK